MVRVTNSNAYAAAPLIVAGYNVSGSVRSDGEPMKGVMFLLFSSSVTKEVAMDQRDFLSIKGVNVKGLTGRTKQNLALSSVLIRQ